MTSSFHILARPRYEREPDPPRDMAEMTAAFEFLRGMATLALTEDGYVVEGHGGSWVHWIKDDKLIVIRGYGRPDLDPEAWWIPFYAQTGDVSQEEMNRLAERLAAASGWEWREGLPEDDVG